MHEMRLAVDLGQIVTEVAHREGLSRISVVNVQFGLMIQVVPDIFRFAFAEVVRGTLAENCEVHIEVVPLSLKCLKCLKEFDISDLSFACAHCGSTEMDIIRGKEMIIESIEGE